MENDKIEKIFFPSGPFSLEGLLVHGKSSRGAVISHPHPLYGGDMYNQVVGLINRAFEERGWTTLRFNFRGVGQSQGGFDQGVGEKDDVSAAVAYLKGLIKGPVVLAGYSFGAWVNARAAVDNPEVEYAILVSPPLGMMDFSFLKEEPKTLLIIAGDQDPFCPLPELKKFIQEMKFPPTLKVIQNADHFYSAGEAGLITAIHETLIEKN
jgi:uncharacterized protein